jgi:hypothetical protein
VALAAPPGTVGGVTGIVGAAGRLGGFVPPSIMGAVYGWQGNYGPGLRLLAVTALIAAIYTARGCGPSDPPGMGTEESTGWAATAAAVTSLPRYWITTNPDGSRARLPGNGRPGAAQYLAGRESGMADAVDDGVNGEAIRGQQ